MPASAPGSQSLQCSSSLWLCAQLLCAEEESSEGDSVDEEEELGPWGKDCCSKGTKEECGGSAGGEDPEDASTLAVIRCTSSAS